PSDRPPTFNSEPDCFASTTGSQDLASQPLNRSYPIAQLLLTLRRTVSASVCIIEHLRCFLHQVHGNQQDAPYINMSQHLRPSSSCMSITLPPVYLRTNRVRAARTMQVVV